MSNSTSALSTHYISLLKEMFTKVVEPKNANLIPHYYSENFELYTNGKTINYAEFLKSHEEIYQTNIQYQIRYDDKTLLEQGTKLAGRVFITTQKGNEPAHEIEVILIAEYEGNKLFRLWELTYPDWSKMKSFEDIADYGTQA